jgi:hypothetical protein
MAGCAGAASQAPSVAPSPALPAASVQPAAPHPNAASPEIVARIDAMGEALRGDDFEAYQAYYAPDVNLLTVAPQEGLELSPMEALRREYDNFHASGTTMERTSDVMQFSSFVVFEFTFDTPGFAERTGMAVLEFNDEGLVIIDHGFTD